LFLSLTFAPVPVAQAQVHGADLAGLLIVLGQLRQNLDGVINTVDTESAARISQLKLALDGVSAEVEKVIKVGFEKAQLTETKLFGDIDDTIERTFAHGEWVGFCFDN
jgi:hypothetical protein